MGRHNTDRSTTPNTPMSRSPHDALLAALDQLTNAVYWYSERQPLTATAALVEALDDWIGAQAAEHHRSTPFAEYTSDDDDLAITLIHLLAAVQHLHSTARPDLTVTAALTEAIDEWAAAQAAEHHFSEPFQRPGSVK